MKVWRMAFIILLLLNIAAVAAFFFLITSPADDFEIQPEAVSDVPVGHNLTVQATKADFEGLANSYIQQEMANAPVPLSLAVGDDVGLSTEVDIFSITLPILLKFEPFVQEDGNLLLKQKSIEVGMLDIPAETALKLLRDSVELPGFMEVFPAEEEVLLKLTELPIDNGISVKAEAFDLKEDDIRLQVTIQK